MGVGGQDKDKTCDRGVLKEESDLSKGLGAPDLELALCLGASFLIFFKLYFFSRRLLDPALPDPLERSS